MKYIKKQLGFSAVELLITLFVASVFLITGFQLYAVIIQNGSSARQQSIAADTAADYLQKYEADATSPCTTQSPLTNSSITVAGLYSVTVSVAIQCPYNVSYQGTSHYSTTSFVSKVVVTISYGNPQTTLVNASYVSSQGIVTNGLALSLDAGATSSYPGTGSTWTDLSGGGNNGTLSATGVTYSTANNGILTFNGTSGSVTGGSGGGLDISGPITMDAWINDASVATGATIFLKSNAAGSAGSTSYGLNLAAGGIISVILYSPTVGDSYHTTSQWIYANTWYNVVATWDGSINTSNNVNVYVNGSLAQSFTKNDMLDSNTQTLTIGSQQASVNFFNGSIGEVKIYNRALTASEVTQNFSALRNRYGV
jgi:Tfp pilus assembly protein PilV